MTENYTQESNSTGLSGAREASLGKLPVQPTWLQRAPNSYKDFGPDYKSKARNPINASRQDQKGVVVDRDAAGGWQEDLTYHGFGELAESVMYAAYRTKGEIPAVSVTAANGYAFTSGGDYFKTGDIIAGVGFAKAANNGRKVLAADGSANDVAAAGLLDEPATTGKISKVGHSFPAADLSITANVDGTYALNSAAGLLHALGVINGETIFIGDDLPGFAFANGIGGFCRVRDWSDDGKVLNLDKMQYPGVSDGAGKSINVYVGRVVKNESDPNLIRKFSYTFERSLGKADDADAFQQAEYLHGMILNTFDIPNNTADKVTTDYGFVGTTYTTRTSVEGPLAGDRPVISDGDAFTTSNDLVNFNLNICGQAAPLYAYLTDLSLNVKNNVKPNKALGILGAFDLSIGNFQVSLSANAYFANVTAQEAIRDNDNVTVGFAFVRNNIGIAVDVPLVTLGDGKPKVTSNNPITVALTMDAARASLLSPLTDYTLMIVFFDYLPTVASGPAQ